MITNQGFTPYQFSPGLTAPACDALAFPAAEINPTCAALSNIWNQVHSLTPSIAFGSCKDSSCEYALGNSVTRLSHLKNREGCFFSVDAFLKGPGDTNHFEIQVKDKHHSMRVDFGGNSLKTETDFHSFFRAEWEDPEDSSTSNEAKSELSLTVDPESPNKGRVLFKQGNMVLSADCQIQDDALSCSSSRRWLSMFGPIELNISRRTDAAGQLHYSFNFIKHPFLPFFSPVKLGEFEFHFDPVAQTANAAGQVSFLNGVKQFHSSLNFDPQSCSLKAAFPPANHLYELHAAYRTNQEGALPIGTNGHFAYDAKSLSKKVDFNINGALSPDLQVVAGNFDLHNSEVRNVKAMLFHVKTEGKDFINVKLRMDTKLWVAP